MLFLNELNVENIIQSKFVVSEIIEIVNFNIEFQ